MVRREGNAEKITEATAEAEPCCTVPAGESPARVIAGTIRYPKQCMLLHHEVPPVCGKPARTV